MSKRNKRGAKPPARVPDAGTAGEETYFFPEADGDAEDVERPAPVGFGAEFDDLLTGFAEMEVKKTVAAQPSFPAASADEPSLQNAEEAAPAQVLFEDDDPVGRTRYEIPDDDRPGTRGVFVQQAADAEPVFPVPETDEATASAGQPYGEDAAAEEDAPPTEYEDAPPPVYEAAPSGRQDYSHLKPQPGDYAYVPYESGFNRFFGTDRFYGVSTIVAGVYSILWMAIYLGLLFQRSVMFTNAQVTMASRGEAAYSVTFSSPMIDVLRIMLYLLPIVLLVWVVAVKHADRTGRGVGNKKVTVAVLCLLVALGCIVLFDLGAAGLVFDIMKL